MRNVFMVLSAPGEVFVRLRSSPTWGVAFLFVVGGNSLLTWLKSCWRGSSFVIDLSVLAGALISVSLSLFLLWSLLALFLYCSSILLNSWRKFGFRTMFSLVSYCGIIYLVGEIVNFALARIEVIKNSSYILPNRFPIGLDLILIGRHVSLPMAVFLHSINPFTIWYLVPLSIGLCTMTGMDGGKARVTVLSVWAFAVGAIAFLTHAIGGTSVGIRLG